MSKTSISPSKRKPQLLLRLPNILQDVETLKMFTKRYYKALSSFQAKNIPLKVHSKYIKKTLILAKRDHLRSSLSAKFLLDKDGERDFILPCLSQSSYFYISDLTLYCIENDEKTLSLLFKSLKLFQRLTSLHIEFFDQTELNNNLNKLAHSFKYLGNLNRLSLSFVSCVEIEPKNIENLYRSLKVLKSLTSITLEYASMNRIGYSEIKTLLSSLHQMKKLTSLEMDLPKNLGDEQEDFEKVLVGLGQLETLKNLDLFFSSHPVQSNHLISTLTKNIAKMKNLNALQLSFSGHSAEDKEIKELKYALRELSCSLKYFSLKFDSCFNVTDEGIYELGQVIKGMKLLKGLTLNFSHSLNITDSGIQRAFRELRNLKDLKAVNLNFDYAIVVRRFESLEDLLDLDEQPQEVSEEIQEEKKSKCNIF